MNSVPYALCATCSIACAVIGHLTGNEMLAMIGTVVYGIFAILLLINHPIHGFKIKFSIKQAFVNGGVVSGFACVGVLFFVAAIIGIIVAKITARVLLIYIYNY